MAATCHDPSPRPLSPSRASERPRVLLIGRPNSGKSTLYNALTGGNAHVGNFPGVTVDILEGDVTLPGGTPAAIADLPGLYSVDAVVDRATDEGIARGFLDRQAEDPRPAVVVQVIDGTQLALGLRLTRELLARPFPMLVVVTQRDILSREGHRVDAEGLAESLGVPVRVVSARDPDVRSVVLAAIEPLLAAPRVPGRRPSCDWDSVSLARRVTVDVAGDDAMVARRRTATARLDAFLLHPALGPLLFLGIMATLFAAVFLVADPATAVIDDALGWLRTRLSPLLGGGLLASFVTDGVLGGCGTVLAFMPQIVILTIAMELLEASGYLARGAFLVDRVLRTLGLSGRSFLPLLMGHACAVPAISSTRTIRDPRERLTTILVLPLMTCSARIPTYALLLGTFFASRGAWFKALAFVGLYASGVLAGLVASLVLRRTATRGRSLPLVLEMPQYRTPQARVVLRTAGRAAWRFTRDVGTTILAVSVALWVLLTLPMPGRGTTPTASEQTTSVAAEEPALDRSIAASVGRTLEPITRPLGFDWRLNVGLIASFGARELMVGTLGVIFGVEDADDDATPLAERLREAKSPDGAHAYGTRTALALLAFFVLACQCMSTVAAVRRETRSWRWPAFVVGYTYALAYAMAFVVYQTAGWIGVH